MTSLFAGAPLDGYESADIDTAGVCRLGGVEFHCSESKHDPRQLDFRTPRLGPLRLVSVSLGGSRAVHAHLYTPGTYLLFNFFPGPGTGVRHECGSHTLWMVKGDTITVVERITKKRLLRSGIYYRSSTIRVAAAAGKRVVAIIDGYEDNETISNALLACATSARSMCTPAWPPGAGVHRFAL